MIYRPLWHGSLGVWDEVASAIGAVIILFLIIRLLFFDRPRDRPTPPRREDEADKREH